MIRIETAEQRDKLAIIKHIRDQHRHPSFFATRDVDSLVLGALHEKVHAVHDRDHGPSCPCLGHKHD